MRLQPGSANTLCEECVALHCTEVHFSKMTVASNTVCAWWNTNSLAAQINLSMCIHNAHDISVKRSPFSLVCNVLAISCIDPDRQSINHNSHALLPVFHRALTCGGCTDAPTPHKRSPTVQFLIAAATGPDLVVDVQNGSRYCSKSLVWVVGEPGSFPFRCSCSVVTGRT